MYLTNIRFKLKLLIFFFIPVSLFGSINIELKQLVPPYHYTIDANDYPRCAAFVKVTKDGSPIALDKEDFFIEEDNFATQPFEVSVPVDGYQKIRWISRLRDYSSSAYIIAVNDIEVSQARGFFNTLSTMSQVRINNINSDNKTEHYFFAEAGTSEAQTKRVYSLINKKSNLGDEVNVLIDSVGTSTENYNVSWRGNYVVPNGRQLPPCEIYPVFQYDVSVRFEPEDDKFHTDQLTVYYDGGKEETINLIGNNYEFPSESNIEILYPNGKEKLTPCQWIEIKWQGHSPGLTTIIEATFDGGLSWKVIGTTRDSKFDWKIPNEPTSHASIRVKQNFEATKKRNLTSGNSKFTKINFNNDGSRLITANDAGFLMEWDMISYNPSMRYNLVGINYPSTKMQSIGVAYIDEDKFAVSYYVSNSQTQVHNDKVVFFERANANHYHTFNLPSGFSAKSMDVDSDREYIAFVPELGNTVLIYNTSDGSLFKTMEFDAPVADAVFYPIMDKMAVALVDGTIEIYEINTFTRENEYQFDKNPYIENIAISPDGNYLAINCKKPNYTTHVSNKAETHIIALDINEKVRTYRGSTSQTIRAGFNPTSNAIILGNEEEPQLIVWDLAVQNNGSYVELGETFGLLNDMAVSPSGSLIASCSISPDVTKPENLQVRQFKYSELDMSDEFFQIIIPELKMDTLMLGVHCIRTDTTYFIKNAICNTGDVPYAYDNHYLKFEGRNFTITNVSSPDTIWPGECRDIEIIVHPQDSGLVHEELVFQKCSGERKIFIYANSREAVVNVSHAYLKFIPELPKRKVMVYNPTGYEIVLEDYEIEPKGMYTVLSPKGILILPHDSTEIEIQWNTLDIEETDPLLRIILGPCSGEGWIHLGPYLATSKLIIPDVNADPRGNATVKIEFENEENYRYDGIRPFETSITINPRLFLPLEVKSEYGEAELLSNTIENDLRTFTIKVNGDFPRNGVLAEVNGVAGIAETFTSPIEFVQSEPQWGVAVTNTYQNGTFQLINVLEGRYVYQDGQVQIASIAPNPAKESALIKFKTEEKGDYTVKLYNFVGLEVYSQPAKPTAIGENTLNIPLGNLPPGQYKVVIRQGKSHSVANIMIVR
jgi:type IX secretion system substrate protein